ncbi:hypothetical protein I7I48_08285 [Histoplasma ohiense]|nr:hypothetical protein I7I48_08285 [Histoplasma ohiense (nom. inval.)]
MFSPFAHTIHQIHQFRSYPYPLRPLDPRAQSFARRFKEAQLLFALLLYFFVVQKGNSSFFQRCRTVLGYCKDIWKGEIRKGGFYFNKQPFFFFFLLCHPPLRLSLTERWQTKINS